MSATGRSWTVWLSCTAGSVALAVSLWALPLPAFQALYGQLLYPSLTALATLLTAWTSLPLGIWIVPLGAGILVWHSLAARSSRPLAARLVRLLLLAAALASLYFVVWGANYRRPPLLELMGVAPHDVREQELIELAEEMLAWIAANAVVEPGEAAAALEAIAHELELLAGEVGWPARIPPGVKSLPPGSLLRSGYAGMIFPFSLEPQVDGALTTVSRVAVGAHELAHIGGFAAEADADAAALIASLRTSDPLARYAAALTLLSRTIGSLAAEERAAILDRLPARAIADLTEARERSQRYLRRSLAQRVTAVYNRLLRSQGVVAGVGDYGRAPLLAAQLREAGALPPPPALPDDRSAQPATGGR